MSLNTSLLVRSIRPILQFVFPQSPVLASGDRGCTFLAWPGITVVFSCSYYEWGAQPLIRHPSHPVQLSGKGGLSEFMVWVRIRDGTRYLATVLVLIQYMINSPSYASVLVPSNTYTHEYWGLG